MISQIHLAQLRARDWDAELAELDKRMLEALRSDALRVRGYIRFAWFLGVLCGAAIMVVVMVLA